jgi:hypothetical protein
MSSSAKQWPRSSERKLEMGKRVWAGLALAGCSLLCSARAEAHFRLVQPPSWLNEDSLGGPQKGSPCGPGNAMLIVGDDVQPVPWSNVVTTFTAGQTVVLQLEETIYHPGYFRVSLARTRAAGATTADFPNPALTDPVDCHYDAKAVATGAHDNVLADGLFMAEGQDGTNRSLMPSIKLPDEPCEECSLQVVQVMEGHPGSSCFYFHCADIRIVAAPALGPTDAGSTADAGRLRDAGNPIEAPGTLDASRAGGPPDATSDVAVRSDASTPGTHRDTSGCSVGPAATTGFSDSACFLLAAAATVVGRRTRRKNAARKK